MTKSRNRKYIGNIEFGLDYPIFLHIGGGGGSKVELKSKCVIYNYLICKVSQGLFKVIKYQCLLKGEGGGGKYFKIFS